MAGRSAQRLRCAAPGEEPGAPETLSQVLRSDLATPGAQLAPMGSLLCRFLRPPRRRPLPGRSRPLLTPAWDTAHPGRHHPAVPAPAPCSGRRPLHRDRRPLPARCHVEPRRRDPLPQAACPPLGLLPVVNWRNPPGQPVLAARSSLGCGPSRTVRIPALGRRFRLLHSLPAQEAKAAGQVPSPPLPLSCPQGMEEKVPEHPGEQTQALGGSGRPQSSGGTPLTSEPPDTSGVLSLHQASPAALDRRLGPSGESSWDSTPMAPMSSSEGPVATSSCGPVGDALAKADRDAAVLWGPTPCRPLPQETGTKEAVAEAHQPVQSTRGPARKDTQAEKPSGMSPRSPVPPASASSRQHKRKIALPLCLPLPPPLPLLWDRGDLPPPPKLPCLALDKDPGTLPNTECPRNKILQDRAKILADGWAAQPAPSSPPLASQTAGSPPLAAHTAQVPVPPTDLADPSAGPPILSVPPTSPTHRGGREPGHGVPKSPPRAGPAPSLPPLTSRPIRETPPRGGPLPPGRATTPTSDRPTPSNASTSFHPPSCTKESPTPMCVDPPPLFLTAPLPGHSTDSSVVGVQPGTSQPTSTIAAKSSALTSKPISNPAVVDMDTTPPSRAVVLSSPPHSRMSCPPFSRGHCSMKQRRPVKGAASTSLPTSMAPGPTPLPGQLFSLHNTPQPTHGTLAGRQQTAFLPSAPIATGLPNLSSGATTTAVGSTSANPNAHSDPDAMDTTSPSRAVIFQTPPGSQKNRLPLYKGLPGSGNTPPSSSTALAHGSTTLPQKSAIIQTPVTMHPNPGIAPHSDPDAMDTTPPSRAVIFQTPPGSQKNRLPLYKGLPGSGNTPPSSSTALAHGSTTLPQKSAIIQTPVTMHPNPGIAPHSDPDAMDTTPPSRAVIFQSPPGSQKNHLSFYKALPGSGNTPPTSSTALAHGSTSFPQKSAIIQTPVTMHPKAGIASQPTIGGHNGQQPNNSYLKGNTVAPTQAIGLPAPMTQPPGGTTMQSGSAGSHIGTSVHRQTAFGNQPGILHSPHSTTTGCGGTTGIPTTGNSSSPDIATRTGPQTVVGPALASGLPVTATMTGPQMFVGLTVLSGSPLTATTTGPQTFVGPALPSGSLLLATTTGPQMIVGPVVLSGSPLTTTTTGPQTYVGPTVPSGLPVTTTTAGPQTFVGPAVPATSTGPQTFVGPAAPSGSPLMATSTGPQTFVGPPVPATTTGPQSFVGPAVLIASPLTDTTRDPGTRGPPAQHVSGGKAGNNINPKTGRPGIPALCQHTRGPPDANTDEHIIVSMMAALCISKRPQNPGGLPVSKAPGATGNSTVPTATGHPNAPPLLQSTQNPRKPQH
ncbi:nuclear pore-associated protein 1-like [Vulpes vulpes]|uniref:Nuclear pore-associated protein 1-like n=1 Tax=Vulpes vulpes TaxID=9627 RepID=A0ABM4ZMU4_VULVU